MSNIQEIIEGAFEDRANISPSNASNEIKVAVMDAIHQLDSGQARVAEKKNGEWVADGGRVLNVTAVAKSIEAAQQEAYTAVREIDWPEGFYRNDIGWRALQN